MNIISIDAAAERDRYLYQYHFTLWFYVSPKTLKKIKNYYALINKLFENFGFVLHIAFTRILGYIKVCQTNHQFSCSPHKIIKKVDDTLFALLINIISSHRFFVVLLSILILHIYIPTWWWSIYKFSFHYLTWSLSSIKVKRVFKLKHLFLSLDMKSVYN